MKLAILDYGMGNLRSVQKAFERADCAAQIITHPDEIDHADKLVVPGVGSFADAMVALRQAHLDEAIVRFVNTGRPFLGICLGLQLLFEVGHEEGRHAGLSIIPGQCIRFDVDKTLHLKVPHMGWNTLKKRADSPLLAGLPEDCAVYFVHSYHVVPANPSIITTLTDYGRDFVSSIRRDNVIATQFHPEKSQKIGHQIIVNFVAM